jgi:putative hydrolase of the HAD superfamily
LKCNIDQDSSTLKAAMNDTPPIKAILFDADGVLQRPSVWWRRALMPILGAVDIAEVDPFLRDILETELAHLCTPDGFDAALMEMLAKWKLSERFADTVNALNAIQPYDDVIAIVRSLRQAGTPCHIASNQQAGRARHMSEALGYKEIFVEEFYSCRVGFAKPDVAFFHRILQLLDLPSQYVLFIDDRIENADAAKRAGLATAVYSGESGAEVLRTILAEHGVGIDAGLPRLLRVPARRRLC